MRVRVRDRVRVSLLARLRWWQHHVGEGAEGGAGPSEILATPARLALAAAAEGEGRLQMKLHGEQQRLGAISR